MAHKPMVNGAVYEIDGGKSLVNGTVYEIDKGKTLVGGTVYGVEFAPSDPIITITGVDKKTTDVIILGVERKPGEVIVVPYGTVITCKADDTGYDRARIYLNGTIVVNGNPGKEVTYEYIATRNATIERYNKTYDYMGDDEDNGRIYITET